MKVAFHLYHGFHIGLECVWLIVGIPSTLLTYKFGYRVSVMFGGVLACTGFALSFFCTELHELYLCIGALAGNCSIQFSSYTVIPSWFKFDGAMLLLLMMIIIKMLHCANAMCSHVCLSILPSVHHKLILWQNNSIYDQWSFSFHCQIAWSS